MMKFTPKARKKNVKERLISFLNDRTRYSDLTTSAMITRHLAHEGFSDAQIQKAFDDLENEGQILKVQLSDFQVSQGVNEYQGYEYRVHKTTHEKKWEAYALRGSIRSCPMCSDVTVPLYDRFRGEIVCYNCGLVLSEKVFVPSWKKEEVTRNDPLYLSNPHEVIFKGRKGRSRAILRSVIFDREELHLRQEALPEMRWICDNLSSPSFIRRYATAIYLDIYRNKIIRQGVYHTPFIVAAIFLAYRYHRIAINEKKVCLLMGISIREVRNALRKIVWDRKLYTEKKCAIPTVKAYLPIVLANLETEMSTSQREALHKLSHQLLRRLTSNVKTRICLVSGKNPWIVATMIVRIISKAIGCPVTLRSLSNVSGLTKTKISKNTVGFLSDYCIELRV